MPNNDDTTCESCKHCDCINHAPTGSGYYWPGCRTDWGTYYRIEDRWERWKDCPRFEERRNDA